MYEMPKMTSSLIAEKALDLDREVKFLYNKVKIGKAEKDRAKKSEESKKAKKKKPKKSSSNSTETEDTTNNEGNITILFKLVFFEYCFNKATLNWFLTLFGSKFPKTLLISKMTKSYLHSPENCMTPKILKLMMKKSP